MCIQAPWTSPLCVYLSLQFLSIKIHEYIFHTNFDMFVVFFWIIVVDVQMELFALIFLALQMTED